MSALPDIDQLTIEKVQSLYVDQLQDLKSQILAKGGSWVHGTRPPELEAAKRLVDRELCRRKHEQKDANKRLNALGGKEGYAICFVEVAKQSMTEKAFERLHTAAIQRMAQTAAEEGA